MQTKQIDTRLLELRERIVDLEAERRERQETLTSFQRRKEIHRRRADGLVTERLSRINGKAKHTPGNCEICGKPHGTVIVDLFSKGQEKLCPITYYVSRVIERWHLGQSAQPFITEQPMEEFLCSCNGKMEGC